MLSLTRLRGRWDPTTKQFGSSLPPSLSWNLSYFCDNQDCSLKCSFGNSWDKQKQEYGEKKVKLLYKRRAKPHMAELCQPCSLELGAFLQAIHSCEL